MPFQEEYEIDPVTGKRIPKRRPGEYFPEYDQELDPITGQLGPRQRGDATILPEESMLPEPPSIPPSSSSYRPAPAGRELEEHLATRPKTPPLKEVPWWRKMMAGASAGLNQKPEVAQGVLHPDLARQTSEWEAEHKRLGELTKVQQTEEERRRAAASQESLDEYYKAMAKKAGMPPPPGRPVVVKPGDYVQGQGEGGGFGQVGTPTPPRPAPNTAEQRRLQEREDFIDAALKAGPDRGGAADRVTAERLWGEHSLKTRRAELGEREARIKTNQALAQLRAGGKSGKLDKAGALRILGAIRIEAKARKDGAMGEEMLRPFGEFQKDVAEEWGVDMAELHGIAQGKAGPTPSGAVREFPRARLKEFAVANKMTEAQAEEQLRLEGMTVR